MASPTMGAVKHVLLAKFKDDVPQERIDELIRAYANLLSLIPLMKSFHWGKEVSRKNKHQGFTHIFESTFDNTDDIAVYYDHPAHVEFGNEILPTFEKYMVVDYEPTTVDL